MLTREQVLKNLEDIVRFGGLTMSSEFVESVRIAMESYENQRDWIPGLPDKSGTYLITVEFKNDDNEIERKTEIAKFYANGKKQKSGFPSLWWFETPTAYKPLPEPYKEDKE